MQEQEFELARITHETNNSSNDNDDLSLEEEIDDSEDMEIISTDEEQNIYNNKKAQASQKRQTDNWKNHLKKKGTKD